MVVVVEEFYKFVYSLQRRIEEHCCQLFWRAYGHENLDSADVINVPQLNAEITHLRSFMKLVINVQFHCYNTQAQLNNIPRHGKIERVMIVFILLWAGRRAGWIIIFESGKKLTFPQNKHHSAFVSCGDCVDVNLTEFQQSCVENRTFTDPLGHRITEHISLRCSRSSSMSSYCQHNASSSYFTDKLTLINCYMKQQRLARLCDVCTVVYTLCLAVLSICWRCDWQHLAQIMFDQQMKC
ncbi:hypothetical protein T4B_9925 [Trichinella pseudospiralis]|uniref:Uncharacterized protein n=1 Tax=Trichinella pseudospiralis TaxID=6337 RepID=A0A0V1IMU1_TRIPS|nr:hypothetical protein T4B_9925 [Trichinella pseudospiralis]